MTRTRYVEWPILFWNYLSPETLVNRVGPGAVEKKPLVYIQRSNVYPTRGRCIHLFKKSAKHIVYSVRLELKR